MKFLRLSVVVSMLALLQSCSKDDAPVNPVDPAQGFYVLSEGAFNANNAKLGFYSLESSAYAGDFYGQQNASSILGDVASDMIIHGGKMYVVVNNSNHVLVLDKKDGRLIQTVTFSTPNKQPRFAAGAGGKVLVTAYDGTVNVIDTASLTISHTIGVGLNPEGIAVVDGFAYVANSGGLNYPIYDSSISVISLSTFLEVEKIIVGKNPNGVIADNNGNIYVSTLGDYGAIAPKLVKVNTTTRTVTREAPIAVGVMRFHNNNIYATGGYLGAGTVQLINPNDLSVTRSNFVTDGTYITMPYGITIDEQNGDVYILDSKDFISSGELFCFRSNGTRKMNFSTTPGVNPVKVAFLR